MSGTGETKQTAARSVPDIDEIIGSGENELLVNLKRLLDCLERGDSRNLTIETLHSLADKLESGSNRQLMLRVVDVPGLDDPIKLLLTPAVFSPEMWGQTFAEGLLKSPERFSGARLVELGSGSGWISLLLLKKTQVKEILGLDINPVAVVIARLNAWLNGTKRDGSILFSQAGQPIVGAFRIIESDLLGKVIAGGDKYDHIIGCIPQVLHPERSASSMDEGPEQRLSERDLYDLSNYCFEQGILEDRFGLPLIARALEQSQLCLKPGGEVTLILGGRPGPVAIESMFERRGFKPQIAWSRRIEQADDTDLASLVALEKAHGIQFHFFMGRNSQSPVSADTAVKLLRNGQKVFHDLLVYRAETNFEKATFGFVENLHRMSLNSLRNELDFSRMTEEQMSFLERLSKDMLKSRTIPYPHERGDLSLRSRLSKFLKIYCLTDCAPEELFIGPERTALLSMLIKMLAGRAGSMLLSESLRSVYGELVSLSGLESTWCNDDLAEILLLDEKLEPDLLVIAPKQLSRPSPINLDALFARAAANPTRFYIIDDSENFEIGSNLNANATLRLSGQMEVPANVILLYGLIKNTVSPDLQLSFLVNAPQKWIENFDVSAEVTYSRIPYPSQLYYEWLFDDLLAFPFPVAETTPPKRKEESEMRLPEEFQCAVSDPVFAPKPIPTSTENLIRLDYGEVETPVPNLLVRGLIKGFIEAPGEGLPALLRQRVTAYVAATRGAMVTPDRVILAQGVFPLFGSLVNALARRLGRSPLIAVPTGSYGVIYPMLAYHGARVLEIPTSPEKGFILAPDDLVSLIAKGDKPDLLWLTQPNNPSGLLFDSNAVGSILDFCNENSIYLLADEIFFLLSDHRLGAWTPPYLSFGSALSSLDRCKYLFMTDGTSKAFSAGGLRCGFMVAPDQEWATEIQRETELPPTALLRAWDNLYSGFLDESPHGMLDLAATKKALHLYLSTLRQELTSNRDELLALLSSHGLSDGLDTPYRGGVFVISKLAEQRDALAKKSQILINSDVWSRTPGWGRICFSLPAPKWREAMTRLESYLS